MTKSKILAAAAILASALASPAMAQEVIYNPGYCAQFYPNANCQNRGPGSPYYGGSYQRQAYRDQAYQDRDPGATATTAGTIMRLLAGRCRGRRRRRRGRHGGCHRHLPDRRRRICPPQRFCLRPRHLVPRRGWPAASLPVGRSRIAFGKGGWKGRLFHAGAMQSGSLGSGPLRPSLIFEPPKIGPSGGIFYPSPIASIRRFSSAVEQRFCKPKVGSSILSTGTMTQASRQGFFIFPTILRVGAIRAAPCGQAPEHGKRVSPETKTSGRALPEVSEV